MSEQQANNPLHGVGLKKLLIEMVDHYGFDILFAYLNINCFKTNPSIESSVKFLTKADWAREKVEAFYQESAKVLPWGHGVFKADHKVQQRRQVWLKRVRLLEMLKKANVTSICDYGAGGGYTSLLAKAMGFSRVVHHEYSVFHPYVAWREKHIPTVDSAQQFIMTCAEKPLKLDEPVDAIICADVAEHVWDPKQMLKDIHAALKPGGYLIWNSVFGEGISCHLHPGLKGREEELLANFGFERVGDLPVDYIGHSGLYRSVPVTVPTNNEQKTPMTMDGVLEDNQWLSRQDVLG